MLAPFYQIVDDARWLERFVPLGLALTQLRIKDAAEAEIRAQIRAAREICGTACTLIVTDHGTEPRTVFGSFSKPEFLSNTST